MFWKRDISLRTANYSQRSGAEMLVTNLDAVKSLTDHPRRLLQRHEESKTHRNASKEYESMYSHF